MKLKQIFLVTLLIALILVAGCTSNGGTGGVTGGNNNNGGGSVGQTKSFDITAKRFSFTPSTITVNQGDTVVLHVTSTDVRHGIAIPEFGVNEELIPGKTVTVTFVADKKGTFTFSCSVFCGEGTAVNNHGTMTGTLIVQ